MAAARIVFAGTPEFAVPSLERVLMDGYSIVAVFTQPDRPAGRGRSMHASPVKQLASSHGLPIYQPVSLKDPATQASMAALSPTLMIVVAYGLILPRAVLDIPAYGCINVHASLLPRWRGAAPIARAIEAGDSETGITLMQMNEGLDTGPMLAQSRVPILDSDTAATLHDRMAVAGAALLGSQLPAFLAGELRPVPQNDTGATYAPKLARESAPVDWRQPANVIANHIRAFNPWPVAESRYGGQRVRLWMGRVASTAAAAVPGTVLSVDPGGIRVAAGDGAVCLTRLQRDGGRPLPAADFVNGFPIVMGGRFE